MAPQLQDELPQLSVVPTRRRPAVGMDAMQTSRRKGEVLPARSAERSLTRTTFNLPFAAGAAGRGEQILQAILEGSQQCMLFSAVLRIPLWSQALAWPEAWPPGFCAHLRCQ